MKVAILGCENSHAWTFAEHINENEKYKDIELVGIFGYDDEGAKKITEKGQRNIGCGYYCRNAYVMNSFFVLHKNYSRDL